MARSRDEAYITIRVRRDAWERFCVRVKSRYVAVGLFPPSSMTAYLTALLETVSLEADHTVGGP